MRNISFKLTSDQFRNRTKTVTRRLGWKFLKAGDLLQGCVKCQGLKPGEKIERLGVIRVVDVRREPLSKMIVDKAYGEAECIAEGFPERSPLEFVAMFGQSMKCLQADEVTRIEFEYADSTEPND